MVLMPNGKEAILVGCMYYTEKLFKLYWNEGNLVWTTMSQTMKYPRSYSPIAMFIPDELNTCKLGKYLGNWYACKNSAILIQTSECRNL